MEHVRRIGADLMQQGRIEITQRGNPFDPGTTKGPIRFGLSRKLYKGDHTFGGDIFANSNAPRPKPLPISCASEMGARKSHMFSPANSL